MKERVNMKKQRGIWVKRLLPVYLFTFLLFTLTGCFGSKMASASGGEVTGTSGRVFSEPAPHGMTLIKRGHLKMGIEKQDSLWGKQTPVRLYIEGEMIDNTPVELIKESELYQSIY
jgi:hypothetical protein